MTKAPRPIDDSLRVAALRAHEILDTPPDPAFDEVAQLAADICGVPTALITFVDDDRQWFKARVGLNLLEMSREHSFCAHAICEPGCEVFEIPDTRADPRFADNPFVTGDPNVRFYAGTPLIDADGWPLGTICVIDRTPRTLTPVQRRGLAALRRFVMASLETRRLLARQQDTIRELDKTRQALESARQVAEQAMDAKGRFLAAMSHELRTPMNAVIGMTTLLRTTNLDGDQTEYVDTIQSSGEVLLTVINDILDLSKLESGRVEIERMPFDFPACIATSVGLLRPQALNKNIGLRVEMGTGVPQWIEADPVRVRQILLNLVSNAVKFTARGEILVRTQATSLADGQWQIEVAVKDTGIGITPDQMTRLFRDFGQAEVSTTRQYGGTGLGLVISKRLAELHGGRLWVESTPGLGSEFHFAIRAGRVAVPPIPEVSAQGAELDAGFARRFPAKILVAEDNPVNQRVATRLLQKLGYVPEVVANGNEALAALRNSTFDVVLMDVEMPELDGIEATRRLRSEFPANSQPVVIALTAHAFIDQRERFAAAGMNSYLSKPIRVAELTTELSSAITARKRGQG